MGAGASAQSWPQALKEAGLSAELFEEGRGLVVKDAASDAIGIRNRGGSSLAELVISDRRVKALDLIDASISDNGIGQVCLRLRRSDQLEELYLGALGHAGLTFVTGVVNGCPNLRSLELTVQDVPTLFAGRQSEGPSDFNTASYKKPEKKEGEEESEGEGEGEEDAAADDDEDDPEAKAKRKEEELRKLFRLFDYDSDEEEEQAAGGGGGYKTGKAAAPAAAAAVAEEVPVASASPGISTAMRGLLETFVTAVDKKENLLSVRLNGDVVPADLQLDLSRAVARHQAAREKKLRAKEERGARTSEDALKDQMEELCAGLEAALEGADEEQGVPISTILKEGDAGPMPTSRLGVRSFVSRRLFAALGEALFECQRFKSKENEAVDTPEGEMAFVAMYLRKLAQKKPI